MAQCTTPSYDARLRSHLGISLQGRKQLCSTAILRSRPNVGDFTTWPMHSSTSGPQLRGSYLVMADCLCLACRQDGCDLLSLLESCIRCVWLRDELRLLSLGLCTMGGC